MPLQPGDSLLLGKYTLRALLGRGGFGFVYLADDTLLHEQVALKELIPALVGDEEILRRFLAEARATMRLTHPRIVRTHDVFAERGNYYIAMEYMAGGSLEARLGASGALPVEEAVQVAAELCEGLACAHAEGVVHCDLKPANVLFDAKGRAKIADFGIAHVPGEMRSRSWNTAAGFVAGTLPYMSPEQADGVRDDPRVDVYAVGAVLYRMLTGRTYLDFDARETPGAQAENVLRIRGQAPLPPGRYNPGIPAWLDRVVLRALAKRREERYGSAAELREALLRRAASPVAARPVPPPAEKTVPMSSQSKPAPVVSPPPKRTLPAWFWPGVGGALALFALVVAATTWVSGRGSDRPPAPTAVPSRPPAVATAALLPSATAKARRATQAPTLEPPTPTPEAPTATPPPTRELPTPTPEAPTATPPPTREPPTPAPPPTREPPTPTPKPALGIGSTMVSRKDGMTLVYVPAGEFLMGSTNADSMAGDREKPQHTVTLDAFWIDRTEVTNAMYAKCVQAGGCEMPAESKSFTRDSYYGNPKYDDYPVIYVNWQQADAYCRWAGKRLPTEAEWEKAARGTDARVYPWGNEAPDSQKANYNNSGGDTTAVGEYPAGTSPYGALDMAGNVWEWVNDWADENYYGVSPGSNPQGPATGTSRVLRGCDWYNYGNVINLRVAYRAYYKPSVQSFGVGFRCVAAPGK
jgi:eukaryotic-like serine/threonine-protein kinase